MYTDLVHFRMPQSLSLSPLKVTKFIYHNEFHPSQRKQNALVRTDFFIDTFLYNVAQKHTEEEIKYFHPLPFDFSAG